LNEGTNGVVKKEGITLSKEVVGTFIDAVYAIAVTILALEVPGELEGEFHFANFADLLVEYAIAFAILFAFWIQHRRINNLVEVNERGGLWLNAFILLLVCILPRATTYVFQYGGDVTLAGIEKNLFHGAEWTRANVVDVFYVGVALAIDFSLAFLARLNAREAHTERAADLRRFKFGNSLLLVFVLLGSMLLPFPNRYFLLLIPIALFFEREIAGLLFRKRGRSS